MGDWLTRGLLAAILLCQVALLSREPAAVSATSDAGGNDSRRFVVAALKAGSPMLVRMDSASGETWRLKLRGTEDDWVPLAESEHEPAEAGSAGRFSLQALRAGTPILIRVDAVSGKVWRLEVHGGDAWALVTNPAPIPTES